MIEYDALPKGYIRLLELTSPVAKDITDGTIYCRLHNVALDSVSKTQSVDLSASDALNDWPELSAVKYDYAKLFSSIDPRRAVRKYRKTQQAVTTAEPVQKNETPSRDLSNAYLALSYVWGPSSLGKTIVVDGQRHRVTDNLHAALIQLQSSHAVRQGLKVWADAICINQGDLEERSQQVQLMQRIYAGAWQIVVWLGPSNEFTELAFTAVRWIAENRHKEPDVPFSKKGIVWTGPHALGLMQMHRQADTIPLKNGTVLSLWNLFSLTYWRRLWILQEAAQATSDAPVHWGKFCVSMAELRAATVYIEANERWLGRRITYAVGNKMPMQLTPQDFTRDRDLSYRDATPGRLWKLALRILDLSSQPLTPASHATFAFETFDLARNAGATDERDKVFAILGLPALQDLVKVVPDYRLSLTEIYTNFSAQLFQYGDLNALRLVQTPLGDLSTVWLFQNEPLVLSMHLKLLYYSPFWPPKNFGNNFRNLLETMALKRPQISTIKPCHHRLPSWTICWSCPSAPTLALPIHFHADAGLHDPELAPVSISGNNLTARCVFVDTVVSLSSFHTREHDIRYPINNSQHETSNSYHDMAGLQEALWRTLLADTMDGTSLVTTDYKSILLSRNIWTSNPVDRLFGMVQLQFGLSDFLRRNKSLSLCGFRLDELLIGPSSLSRTARDVTPKTQADLEAFEVISRATNILAWRRLIVTNGGRIGLATAATEQYDRVVVIRGCGMPMVLRPEGERWRVVGECYLHGIMKGEVAKMVEMGRSQIETVHLC